MSWLALDIGGANLKAADGQGFACSVPFPLWQQREQLPEAIATVIARAPRAESLAITMTGELADCFATKAEGVEFIIRSVLQVSGCRECFVYAIPGELLPALEAIVATQHVAASNWHVLAQFAARYIAEGSGLLIDIGSTTCDIIPVVAGRPCTIGLTDTRRLLNGELVYSGVERTPICAITSHLPYRGQMCPVAAELFATSLDVYLLHGKMQDDFRVTHTADGRPATVEHAHDRLARLICADRDGFTREDAEGAAGYIAARQTEQIAAAVRQVLDRQMNAASSIVLSGSGEFLADRVLKLLREQRIISPEICIMSLRQKLGPTVSECAPAHALAVFAQTAQVAR